MPETYWPFAVSGDADDQEGAPPVAVMSFHAWQEKYRSDASVVGSTYQINGRAFTIIGVAPAGFIGRRWWTGACRISGSR